MQVRQVFERSSCWLVAYVNRTWQNRRQTPIEPGVTAIRSGYRASMVKPAHLRVLRLRAPFAAITGKDVGGDGWESNPPRTPQQRPANGFEDRGPDVHDRPPASAQVRYLRSTFRSCAPSSAVDRRLGCHFGCHVRKRRLSTSAKPATSTLSAAPTRESDLVRETGPGPARTTRTGASAGLAVCPPRTHCRSFLRCRPPG